MTRQWVKLWVNESLRGTIRFDFSPEERCVWYELIILGGYCRLAGTIGAGEGKPYPDDYIASLLNVPVDLLRRTVRKCIETERISKNGNGYKITNWEKYQSEYDRQKPYRQGKAAKMELEKERERLGLCKLCGEKGHDKYNCPHSKYGSLVQR